MHTVVNTGFHFEMLLGSRNLRFFCPNM